MSKFNYLFFFIKKAISFKLLVMHKCPPGDRFYNSHMMIVVLARHKPVLTVERYITNISESHLCIKNLNAIQTLTMN